LAAQTEAADASAEEVNERLAATKPDALRRPNPPRQVSVTFAPGDEELKEGSWFLHRVVEVVRGASAGATVSGRVASAVGAAIAAESPWTRTAGLDAIIAALLTG